MTRLRLTLLGGFEACGPAGDVLALPSRKAQALLAYARAGRMTDALPLLERAAGHVETIRFAYSHALVVATLGEARLLGGDIDGAGRCADEARALAQQYGQVGWEAWARRLQGEVASRRDSADVAAAEAHYQAAMSLAEERGMRPLLTHCRLGLGEASARAGKNARARDEIVAALAEYRAMDMPHWRDRGEAVLARL